MTGNPIPRGRTRISSAVITTIAVTAAREVHGVIDIVGITKAAALGAAVGGAVGMAGGGVTGAVLGVSAGSAFGAATAHLLTGELKRVHLHNEGEAIPVLKLHLSAVYGRNLTQLAEDVRVQVRQSIHDVAGLDAPNIDVVFTEVIEPTQ